MEISWKYWFTNIWLVGALRFGGNPNWAFPAWNQRLFHSPTSGRWIPSTVHRSGSVKPHAVFRTKLFMILIYTLHMCIYMYIIIYIHILILCRKKRKVKSPDPTWLPSFQGRSTASPDSHHGFAPRISRSLRHSKVPLLPWRKCPVPWDLGDTLWQTNIAIENGHL